MRAMENDPRQKQPGEKFMVKELPKKLNYKYISKIAWKEAGYIKYKEQVESARIDKIYSLITEFNNWSTLSEEEENNLDKIIKDLENYLNLLYKINEELKDYLKYLEE